MINKHLRDLKPNFFEAPQMRMDGIAGNWNYELAQIYHTSPVLTKLPATPKITTKLSDLESRSISSSANLIKDLQPPWPLSVGSATRNQNIRSASYHHSAQGGRLGCRSFSCKFLRTSQSTFKRRLNYIIAHTISKSSPTFRFCHNQMLITTIKQEQEQNDQLTQSG